MSLAFPTDAQYQDYRIDAGSAAGYTNDESETGTPFSANIHDELVIDPALLAESNTQGALHPPYQVPQPPPIFPENYAPASLPPSHQPYPPGPFGDPYVNPAQNAIYPPANYFQQDAEPFIYPPPNLYPPHEPPFPPTPPQPDHHPPNHQQPPKPPVPPKSTKRKRKKVPPREENCSFCGGSDLQNKLGKNEPMVSCVNCGRSGHPSCLQIPEISDVIRSYNWKCIECKTCEICKGKGDDTCLLFCDQCDRGWHSYCLKPPLPGPPSGSWACPICVPMPAEGSSTARRSSSIASSSQYVKKEQEPETTSRSRRKGKGKEAVDDVTPEQEAVEVVTSASSKDRNKKGRPPKVPNGVIEPTPLVFPPSPPVPPPPLPPSPTRSATQRTKGRAALDDMLENGHTIARVRLRLSSTKKGKGKARDPQEGGDGEADEEANPFEGILNDVEADVSKTNITTEDKNRYEKSRIQAEAKLQPPPVLLHVVSSDGTQSPKIGGEGSEPAPSVLPSRPLRSLSHHSPNPNLLQAVASKPVTGKGKGKGPPPAVPDIQTPSPPLRIKSIRFGDFEIDTWFDAPFPEEYTSVADGTLWICEFCLKYMKSRFSASRHRLKCKARHPPGDEIYRDDSVSVFEVDGRKNKIYCQNLCLLSKMFLDHKSLFYDVEPFLFYVMTETDERGAHFVGYFSKEKRSVKDYNLSCIMTLPVRQRKGWGNLLIDFSYLLSRLEGRIGGPETPLSALGAISYHRYWSLTLMYYFQNATEPVTLSRISAETSITRQDILATLEKQGMITIYDDPRHRHSHKTPKPRGRPPKHASNGGIARRNLTRPNAENGAPDEQAGDDPSASWLPRKYCIKWDHDAVNKYILDWEKRGYLRLRAERLKWSPFVLARTQAVAGVEFAGGSGNENASVETMLRIAGNEESDMLLEISQQQAKAQEADENFHSRDGTPARSSRHRSGAGRARSLVAGRDRGGDHSTPGSESRFLRSRSVRDLGETSSRASRSRGQSRATSLSGDDQDDNEGSVGRPQMRLRPRSSIGVSSRAAAISVLQKRKRDSGNTTQEEESDEIEYDRKRLRKRLSRGRSLAPQEPEDTSDLESIAIEDRSHRSLRSSKLSARPNGLQGVQSRKSLTPLRVPRKRQRVDSSPEPDRSPRHSPPAPTTINHSREIPSSPDNKLPSEEALVTPKSNVTPRHLRSGNGLHTTSHKIESRTPKGRPRAANGTFSSRNKAKNTSTSPDICPLNVKPDVGDKVNGLRQLTIDQDLPRSDGVENPPTPADAESSTPALGSTSGVIPGTAAQAPTSDGVDPLQLLAYAATDSLGAATATDEDRDAEGEVEEEIELDDADADGETDEGEWDGECG